ncbi:hypothetical protein ACFOEQ_05850 [Chryseobacterium arachidis]|uniref:hypothetical protein n=1 Tax=Chryseobacterium arachidis TaxID=1416778 RepID=UPI003614E7A8
MEKLGHEYIIGVEGEIVVNHKDFYSMFHTPTFFKVSSQGVKIGELPLSPQIKENENIFLSAKIWKIKYVDYEMNKIEVVPARDGKKPIFLSDGADTAQRIREKMLEVLFSNVQYEFLDKEGQMILDDMRSEFAVFSVNDFETQRPLMNSNDNLELFSFAGSKINKSIGFIYDYLGVEHEYFDHQSLFTFGKNTEINSVHAIISFTMSDSQINDVIRKHLELNPTLINVSKWGAYLPLKFQIEILKKIEYDFEGCFNFLQNLRLVENN